MSRAKAKGTLAETALVQYLQGQGWPLAHRRTTEGAHDRGDVGGIPDWVVEVKNTARLDLAGWLSELEREMGNDDARFGVVWAKRVGTTNPGEWYCILPGRVMADVMRVMYGLNFEVADWPETVAEAGKRAMLDTLRRMMERIEDEDE